MQYQEDDSHYNLLVRADSKLALQDTVPQRIGKLLHKQNFDDVPLACEDLNKSPPPPAPVDAIPDIPLTQVMKTCLLIIVTYADSVSHSCFSTAVSLGEMCPFGPVQLK